MLVGDEHSYSRKYREVVIAAKINQEESKDQILENYLNTIYFGRGAYGIQAAAQAYFGRDVNTLTPAEGAVLAGLIQSPSKWDPAVDLAGSQQRWNYVLDGMVQQKWLSPTTARPRCSRRAGLKPPSSRKTGIPDDDRGHVVTAIKNELASYGITEQQVNQEGLKVATTVDPKLQQQAADAAVEDPRRPAANLRTAMVSEDPRTGAVLAYYGGTDGLGLRLRPDRAPARVVVQAVRAARRPPAQPARSDSARPSTAPPRRRSRARGSRTPTARAARTATSRRR